MILTQLEKQMDKMNVSIDKAVFNAINSGQNQHCTTPTDDSPTLTPANQLINNNVTP